ncbi:dipeptidase [Candidatus Hydrogenedentota bacterium]
MSGAKNIFLADTHVDTLRRLSEEGDKEFKAFTGKPRRGHVDLARLKKGDVGLLVMASCTDKERYVNPTVSALRMIDTAHRLVETYPADLALITSSAEIRAARKARKIAIMLSLENGVALGGCVEALRMFYRLGVRALGLTWNFRNQLADGVNEAGHSGGLSSFGREVVAAMGELGMIVDVSHLNEKSFWEVIAASQGPIIASHSNCRAICDHPRNLTDEQIRAIADRSGYIGVNFYSRFLKKRGRARLEDVTAHISHIISVGGIKTPGIGSDYDGIDRPPIGLPDISRHTLVTEAVREGFSEQRAKKILGENCLRVIKDVVG